MIKFMHILILLLLTGILSAQNSVSLIKGYVFSDDALGRKEPIKNAKIKLTASTGAMQETLSDSMGNYFIRLKNFEGSV